MEKIMAEDLEVFDTQFCSLGEGIIWHPLRNSVIWFDILEQKMFEKASKSSEKKVFDFDLPISAAGIINESEMLVATSRALEKFNLTTKTRNKVVDLEATSGKTRSNDGRADPYGGFWIGTMGMHLEKDVGSYYRYYKGELRKIYDNITVPNATCFSTCGEVAYFSDTAKNKIWSVALDKNGWPKGEPKTFLDFTREKLLPDGAVIDMQGNLWNAQWGSSRVACYDPTGKLIEEVLIPASQVSCLCIGGDEMSTLFVTSAREGLGEEKLLETPLTGMTFTKKFNYPGQLEHRVVL